MFDLPTPVPSLQVELATTGMSKGLAQTRGPQVVVRPGLSFGNVLIEASVKNIANDDDKGVEIYISAGFATRVSGIDLSGRGGLKSAHGTSASDRRAFEARVDAGRNFGALRTTLSIIYSPDDLGATRSAAFYEGGLAWDVREKTRIAVRIGRRERGGATDYTAYSVGITREIFPQLTADLRVYGSGSNNLGHAYRRRLVATLRAKL